MTRYPILYLLILFSCALHGQDVHFSQFFNAPTQASPANVGAMRAHQRLAAHYRHQWFSVPVPYETVMASYDQKVKHRMLGDNWLGVGGQFLYDRSGAARLDWTQLTLQAAYHYRLSEQTTLSIGGQARVGQRALEPGQLFFGDQYTDNFFDPSVPTQEAFTSTSDGFFSLGSGLAGRWAPKGSRSEVLISGGVHHLNRPVIQFLNEETVAVPILWNNLIHAQLEVAERWDIVGNGLLQVQGPYLEWVGLLGARLHLDNSPTRPLSVQLSGGVRRSDALIAYLGFFYQDWRVGVSYDVNTSPLQRASNYNGGPELSVQYLIYSVEPPKTSTLCPLF